MLINTTSYETEIALCIILINFRFPLQLNAMLWLKMQ